MVDGLNMSRRIRRSPFADRVEQAGVRGYSVVNHMLLPKAYRQTPEEDYWHLREHVQIWDVACQRQVQLTGPDAEWLAQWMTPRKIGDAKIGDCMYLPLVDHRGGMVNDPVLLKIAEDRFWLSVADSDVLLYATGLAIGSGAQVDVEEPDVSPLAIQGPQAENLLASVFGEGIRRLGRFKFNWFEFKGTRQLIARSGYSRQGGFEIYLNDGDLGPNLWDRIQEAGEAYGLKPGCPNLIERIEGGLLSYGNEMTRANNPLELGMDRFCALDGSVDFVGLRALQKIAENGARRHIRGLVFGGDPVPACSKPWPVMVENRQVGHVTSAARSPRLNANVGLAMIDRGFWDAGREAAIHAQDDLVRPGRIVDLPIS